MQVGHPADGDELILDSFAGGGGAGLGLEEGLGRAVDLAINHDPDAVIMHAKNHPATWHLCESVWKFKPVHDLVNRYGRGRFKFSADGKRIVAGIGHAWFSPDCRHFSRAKGGKPVSPRVRGLAWFVVKIAKQLRPTRIYLENVREFADWGPLKHVRDADDNPMYAKDGSPIMLADSVARDDMPIKAIAPWFGGKRTMASRIVAECCRPGGRAPKAFWDLCCGSMAVSMEMPRCSHHHAVDLHGDLLNLITVLQDRKLGPELYRRLRRVVSHESSFYESRNAMASDAAEVGLFGATEQSLSPIDRAFHYFIVSWQGRNGTAGTERINYQPAIRWTAGGGHSAIRFANATISVPAWRRRLRDISVLKRDIFDVLVKIEDQVGTSIYIDPPYLRDGKSRSGSCAYKHEFNSADHDKLSKALRRFENCRVVVSYYDHPQLRELYPGWTVVECSTQKNLHVHNRRGVGRCEAPEILIINGPSYTAG